MTHDYQVALDIGVAIFATKPRLRRCRRCGKRWCGSNIRSLELGGFGGITYGSKKCRRKGAKRERHWK